MRLLVPIGSYGTVNTHGKIDVWMHFLLYGFCKNDRSSTKKILDHLIDWRYLVSHYVFWLLLSCTHNPFLTNTLCLRENFKCQTKAKIEDEVSFVLISAALCDIKFGKIFTLGQFQPPKFGHFCKILKRSWKWGNITI